MQQTPPEFERSRLGFAASAEEEFAFLIELGLRLVGLDHTLARYESDRRFVQVFHGRGSYELGVGIGRWIDVDGVTREQVFPLRDVVALRCDPAEVGYGETSATTAEATRKFLRDLAGWTREFAGSLLTDGDEIFRDLSERNARRADAEEEGMRASRLRARAEEAWRRRDFGSLANAYGEIDRDLPTVELSASERSKLDYALRALGEKGY